MLASAIHFSEALKLHGTENYAEWSIRTQRNLEKLGLWSLVDGTEPEPPCLSARASQEEIRKSVDYNNRAQEARRYIVSRLGDGPYNAIIYKKSATSPSARYMWDALRARYQERGDGLRYALFKELAETKWDGENPLDDHAEHFSRLMKRLNNVAEADGLDVMPEWIQISLLLQSIEGVHEGVQKNVVDVLKGGNLRKKKFVDIVGDLKENGHFARMLELYRINSKDGGEKEDEKMMVGWVEATV